MFNTVYDVPIIQVALPGRQNRLTDQELILSPGGAHHTVFRFGTSDGVPLSTVGFEIFFVVWATNTLEVTGTPNHEPVFSKRVKISDPYSGMAELLLSNDDTRRLHNHNLQGLRWGLMMSNQDKQLFPLKVSQSGGVYANLKFTEAVPSYDQIRMTLSPEN